MSNEPTIGKGNDQQPKQAPTLVITLNDKGQLQVAGPIADKALCLRMIAGSINAILDYNANNQATQQPMIVKPGFLEHMKMFMPKFGRRK
jgi:hypothetical protein